MNRELGVTEYYPNSRFGMHTDKPVLMMLDEFTKAAEPVKNMLHPLLESSNRVLEISQYRRVYYLCDRQSLK